jgi:anti-anti-sigma factor
MPIRITQQESESGWKDSNGQSVKTAEETIFKVQGSLYLEDAELLEKICSDFAAQNAHHITLDLADLSFLDSESASVLCRLRREQNVTLEGLHLFIAKVIELTEAEAAVSEYLPRTCETHRI